MRIPHAIPRPVTVCAHPVSAPVLQLATPPIWSNPAQIPGARGSSVYQARTAIWRQRCTSRNARCRRATMLHVPSHLQQESRVQGRARGGGNRSPQEGDPVESGLRRNDWSCIGVVQVACRRRKDGALLLGPHRFCDDLLRHLSGGASEASAIVERIMFACFLTIRLA